MNSLVISKLILLSVFVSSKLQAQDLQVALQEKCDRLVETFGRRTINYSYQNFQGLTVNVNPVVFLEKFVCVPGINGIAVVSKLDLAQEVGITYFGSVVNGAMTFQTGVAPDYGSCTNEAPKKFIEKARMSGKTILPQVETSIYKNYREVACPALRDAVARELANVTAQINTELDQ